MNISILIFKEYANIICIHHLYGFNTYYLNKQGSNLCKPSNFCYWAMGGEPETIDWIGIYISIFINSTYIYIYIYII